MRAHARRAHYVRPNETTRIPRRHIIFDTESHRVTVDGGEVQTWRCAAATFLASEGRREPPVTHGWYDDPSELWEAVSGHARARKRTVLWAHNLAYDLRVAAAFDHLPAMGWELVDVNLAQHGSWVRWRRDTASLVMVDSTAVWPCSLAELADDVGMAKPALPAEDAGPEEWRARCEADVAILTAAVTEYLAWLERDDLGNWQMTGAGQSWAAWRHRFYSARILCHDSTEALAAERRAMWTGRCEAWRHGRVGAGGVFEYDFSAAYARIAEVADLPTRLVADLGPITTDRFDSLASRYAVLCDVEVTTEVETVPTMIDGRIAWPVGTFTSTLWDVEVNLARDFGATVEIRRAWTYLTAPALSTWATWVLAQIDPATSTLSPLCRRVVKHWSRALIGRFAMRYRRWEPFATTADATLDILPGADMRDGSTYEYLRAGRQVLRRTDFEEGESSAPAITGYVMAIARVRLWRAMVELGLDRVLYVDTDSMMVDGAGRIAAEQVAADHPDWHLRCKRSWRGAEILGPRQLLLGGEPRVAGIPRAARRVGAATLAGEVWESLQGAIRHGRADQVIVKPRRWHLRGVDNRRSHLLDGFTVARRALPFDRGDDERQAV